jgi:hypothetical protein
MRRARRNAGFSLRQFKKRADDLLDEHRLLVWQRQNRHEGAADEAERKVQNTVGGIKDKARELLDDK